MGSKGQSLRSWWDHIIAEVSPCVVWLSKCYLVLINVDVTVNEEWNVAVEAVFEKLWKGGVFKDSEDNAPVYLDIHDAVLAAVELDATLHQQVFDFLLQKLYTRIRK